MQQQTFFSALSHSIKGRIFLPADEEYALEIPAFNTSVIHRPDVVVAAISTNDILTAVRLANQYGYSFSVQATGHGALEPITSGMLISTRGMNKVSVDPKTSIASISASAKWKDVNAAAIQHGLFPIAGASVDVGVVGYILGGGLGPLARSHGFSSDYLTGLTIVTNSGELLQACEKQNPELFWALRGGKVGFGIVTEIHLRLVKTTMLYAGSLFFEEKNIETALRNWIDWTGTAGSLVTTSVAIINFPSIAAIPEMFRGRRLLTLRFAYPGSIQEGIRLASPLRSMAPVYFDALGELSASETGRIHNDPSTPIPFWGSGVLLNSIDQNFVSNILREFGKEQSRLLV